MGRKVMQRMAAVFLALVMVMTCGVGVFADSLTTGAITSVTSHGPRSGKSITIEWTADKAATQYIVKVGNKTYTTTATSLKVKTKANKKYKITVTPVYNGKEGTSMSATNRWTKATKIYKTKSYKKKVKLYWNKVKKATQYQVLMYQNGKWTVVKTTKKTRATIKVSAKGKYKFKVVPIRGSYVGIRSKTKTGRAK